MRFIQRGAHQQSSPSIFMIAGTRNMRITVASSSSAAIRPNGQVLHHHQVGEDERAADDDQDQRRGGDDAAGGRGADAGSPRWSTCPRARASTMRDTRNTS